MLMMMTMILALGKFFFQPKSLHLLFLQKSSCGYTLEAPCHYENTPFKYTENVTTKNWKFSYKNSDIFHISAPNIDCGYSLEPPWWGGSNKYPQSMFLSRNKKK